MKNVKADGSTSQHAEKIINVENAKNVNIVSEREENKKIYSKFFTQELISHLKNVEALPPKYVFTNSEGWVDNFNNLKLAQSYIRESFIWIIGEELRRMLLIGTIGGMNNEDRISKYIFFALRTYRSALQLMNYVLLSKLLDEKIKEDGNHEVGTKLNEILQDKPCIKKFFTTEINLELIDLRMLFQELVQIYKDCDDLIFPIEMDDTNLVDQFIDSNSDFNTACLALEELQNLQGLEKTYSYENCETAEKSLATVLSKLVFLTKYVLMSVKHIEYEESRNNDPQYIKEMRIIKLPSINKEEMESDAMDNLMQTLMYDDKPQKTNSVLFHKKKESIKNSINLFPFIIDKNALYDQREFDLLYYEHLNLEESKLMYYSTKTKVHGIEDIEVQEPSPKEMKNDKTLEKFIIDKRIELVSKQFQLARNVLTFDDFDFTVEEEVLFH